MPLTRCSRASWSTLGLAVRPGGRSSGTSRGSLALAVASVAGGVGLGRVAPAPGRSALGRGALGGSVALGGRVTLGSGGGLGRGALTRRVTLGARIGLGGTVALG